MNLDLRFYWTLFIRRLPAMAAVFLLCATIGVVAAYTLPETYSSKARMMIQDLQIAGLGAGGGGDEEQLERIQNRLMTRTNLLNIASDYRVFGTLGVDHNMNPSERFEAMRAATTIRTSAGRNRAATMSIEFKAKNPKIAFEVVNAYVSLIIEENNRLQRSRTGNTLEFFKQQVEELNKRLDAQSALILAFKQENQGALPDSLNYRLTRESSLQERVTRTEREIDEIRDQRQRIIDIFEATGRIQAPQRDKLSPAEQQLAALNAKLDGMLLTFSDTNPRVRVLQTQIAQLEAQIAAQGGAEPQADVSQQTLFELNLAQIDTRIATLEEEKKADEDALLELRASIEATSTNQIALDALQRDYANAQSQYNAAVERRDTAQISENANTSGYSARIEVIEPPTPAESPSNFDPKVIMAAGMGAGVAAMAGLFLLLELLNRTIRRPVELTKALGVTPMATIPYMQTRRHFWTRRILKLALLIAVIIAVPLAFWAINEFYRPLDLIFEGLLRRLGL